MSRTEPRVVILGAGPAGLGAAYRLRRDSLAAVTVAEQRDVVGGNAGSFEISGQRVDFGSHRLHPSCDPDVLADIRSLLGADLVARPRHGRIRLEGRWIHFPPRPLDLLLRADRRFALGVGRDFASKLRAGGGDESSSFADVLLRKLGPTICHTFYFPYARKIWGREPDELSPIQARRRVAADSPIKLLRKVFGRLPGVKPVGFRHFLYPRQGYGQISEAYARAAQASGAELLLGWKAAKVQLASEPGNRVEVTLARDDERRTIEGDLLWSTIPITALARISSPAPPSDVQEAARSLEYRAMLLVYLALEADRFSEYDAHYFPGADVRLTRLSEPRNYSGNGPPGRTVLCAEIPCSPTDEWWTMSEEELGTMVEEDMAASGIPLPVRPSRIEVRKLRQAYPIYLRGYETAFAALDRWVESLPGLLSFGRQGLFAHDNTHHALRMAYCAAECLGPEGFDHDLWRQFRTSFEEHVVED